MTDEPDSTERAAFQYVRDAAKKAMQQMYRHRMGPQTKAASSVVAGGGGGTITGEDPQDECPDCVSGVCDRHEGGDHAIAALADEVPETEFEHSHETDVDEPGDLPDTDLVDEDEDHKYPLQPNTVNNIKDGPRRKRRP